MLAEYLRAAKEVVQAKQERPGVAVHVRFGGGSGGVGQEDGPMNNSDCAGSYAVWALTASRDDCGVARLACSEMAQTEVPRSAVQRVQVKLQAYEIVWIRTSPGFSLGRYSNNRCYCGR